MKTTEKLCGAIWRCGGAEGGERTNVSFLVHLLHCLDDRLVDDVFVLLIFHLHALSASLSGRFEAWERGWGGRGRQRREELAEFSLPLLLQGHPPLVLGVGGAQVFVRVDLEHFSLRLRHPQWPVAEEEPSGQETEDGDGRREEKRGEMRGEERREGVREES